MLTIIRGAGDIASGIALRLWRAGIQARCFFLLTLTQWQAVFSS